MLDFAKSIMVGNAEYDIVYQGHALSDEEIEKIKKDPASKSKLRAEYKDMVRQGVISLAEFNAMQREIGNKKVGNSNKAEIIEKKKKEGATLKVDNGQKLEFSDGSTYVKTSFSDDYREAHNYTGNTRTGNSYYWDERHGHQELYNPAVPFGGHVRGYVEKTKNGYVGAKTNGSILISKKEFATEAEAKKFVENSKVGNKKVGNGITKFGVGTKVIAEGHKAQVTYESVERGPNGIPFGWVRVVFIEGPWKGEVMEYYDYDLKRA